MAFDVHRWLQYAKARIDSAVNQGNTSLDRLEAEREVELADKPWLRSDAEAPTLDEARARIEWEARQQAAGPGAPPAPPGPGPQDASPGSEATSARLQLEAREQASAARLAAIRKELGVDAPADPPAEPPAP